MKQYAVIHAVAGLFEGYSDTTCEFFPDRGLADKHVKQLLDAYRKDEMCVNIDHRELDIYVTLTRDYEDYHACVPSDMEHDDWVAENMDDVSVEVFRVIELDMSNRSDSTESCWLTWDQQDATQAWDYFPLCMSLVARVSSDINDGVSGESHKTFDPWVVDQLNDFIQSVYYRNHASSTLTTTQCTLSVSPNPKTLTAMTRHEKLTRYVEAVIEGMDYKDMYEYMYRNLLYDLEHSMTDEELDEAYNEYFEDNDE